MNDIDVRSDVESKSQADSWDIDFDDEIDWSEHVVDSWAKNLEQSMLKDVN